MTTEQIEIKRKKWDRIVKVLIALAVGCIAFPFAFIGIAGLVGLVGIWIVSETCICLAPWASMKFANWRIKLIKMEANKNPIETMENIYAENTQKLAQKREDIKTFRAAVQTFAGKLEGYKSEFPQDAMQHQRIYDAMVQLLELRKRAWRQAKANLATYKSVIHRAKAKWAMAEEAAKLRNSAGADVDEFYNQLKIDTALDSVENAMNLSFADLEDALLDEKDGMPVVEVMVKQNVALGAAPTVVAQLPAKSSVPDLDLDFDDHDGDQAETVTIAEPEPEPAPVRRTMRR